QAGKGSGTTSATGGEGGCRRRLGGLWGGAPCSSRSFLPSPNTETGAAGPGQARRAGVALRGQRLGLGTVSCSGSDASFIPTLLRSLLASEPQTSRENISQPMEMEEQLEETVQNQAQVIGRLEEANVELRGRIRDLTAQLQAAENCFVTHGILLQRVGFSESLDGHEKGKLTRVHVILCTDIDLLKAKFYELIGLMTFIAVCGFPLRLFWTKFNITPSRFRVMSSVVSANSRPQRCIRVET
ncbi:hypothetical protein lerEdw1_010876, partial [Lerista edwardsae]